MAIIVDKEEKRRNIALSCRDLLLEHGIENLTIAQIAKAAGVGKGTIYEYFENKEDVVFEIITPCLEEDLAHLEVLSDAPLSTREKLFRFGYAFFEREQRQGQMKIFHEFLAITLLHKNKAMLAFSEQTRARYRGMLERIIVEGIDKGELEERFRSAAGSLIVFSSGLMVDSRLEHFDVKHELNAFLDLIFPLFTGEHR